MILIALQDITKLVCRLLMIARQREKEVHINLDGWVARPLTVSSGVSPVSTLNLTIHAG
jgi:hypothetical protein